ncbi:MAG: thymidylate kinase [Micavibrio sp.]|nr:MAG: thymidylate kinase [Micavibrio sp.]
MSAPSLFITFEGGEGAGKTTQINLLAKRLGGAGYKVVTTREPGGTKEAETIRNLLVQREGGDWSPMAECLLLFAARVMHVKNVIKPALVEGQVVICDRFTDSTRAYQGYGHGLDLQKIEEINIAALDSFGPDMTFVFDIDPEQGLARSGRRLAAETLDINQTEDRFENMDIEFHEKLRQGYLEIAKNEPERCHVIDASGSAEEIAAEIEKIVKGKLL